MACKLTPIKKLTVDAVDNLIIHHTVDSLRRAADSKEMIRQNGNYTIPTLFYINDGSSWSIHAMIDDLCRFLMIDMVYVPEPEPDKTPKIHSKIRWDGVTGGKKIKSYVDGGIIGLSGEIEQDENGKYMSAVEIVPDKSMIEAYPDATLQIGQDKAVPVKDAIQEGIIFVMVDLTPKEDGGVSEILINLKWSDKFIEHFSVGVPDGGMQFN